MKNLCLLLATIVLFSFTVKENNIPNHNNTQQEDADQNSNDKKFLLDYFQQTSDALLENVKGLSEAEMQYKPSPEKWSISQCLEHIVLTEAMLFKNTKELLAKPANPERKEEVKVADQEIIDGMSSRSTKVKAPKELQPEGKYVSPEVALSDLNGQRAEILKLIKKTSEEDLRNHITDSPFGPVDAYHSLLYIAGHVARHTSQIKEVKADPGFPSE